MKGAARPARNKARARLPSPLGDYLEALIEGFVVYDERWRMTYMNAAAEQMLGERRARLLGKTWHEAFPHAVGNPVDEMYQRVMRTRRPERMDFDYRAPYGAQPWGRKASIIALTGWGQEEDRRRTRDAGFDGHLVKPADTEALLKILER